MSDYLLSSLSTCNSPFKKVVEKEKKKNTLPLPVKAKRQCAIRDSTACVKISAPHKCTNGNMQFGTWLGFWFLTFLHHTPPPLGPVTELQGIALFYLCSLLEAADQLVAQPVAVVDPLHSPFVVPRLQRNKTQKHKASKEADRCRLLATSLLSLSSAEDEIQRQKWKKSGEWEELKACSFSRWRIRLSVSRDSLRVCHCVNTTAWNTVAISLTSNTVVR